MPTYDVLCSNGHTAEIVTTWDDRHRACDTCGVPTERLWTASASVIGDECDFVQHNGTREPIRFRSKVEFRRWCKQHDYTVRAQHVGVTGSDKSPHTCSQSAVTAKTLADAKAMLERDNRVRTWVGEDGITSGEGLVRFMADKKREERGQYF